MPLAVCATPIGNLDDVTLRVLDELRAADLVLCEDTRRTRVLLDRHGIHARSLVSCHRHNEARRVGELIPRLVAGERVALVSDAGLPGVNDPGARVVAAALELDLPVTVLPGASAVETALVASGLAGDQYRFLGYLPRRAAEADRLWDELDAWPHPAIAFESPHRLPASLARLAARDPSRPVAVCRELTKRFEEVVRGPVGDVAVRFSQPPKGEITLVLGASARAASGEPTDGALDEARAAVAELIAAGTTRRTAADVVARLTGVGRRALYDASLPPAPRS